MSASARQGEPSSPTGIRSVMQETRTFGPPKAFASKAHVKSMAEYEALYQHSIDDPEAFWTEVAADFHFFQKWDRVLEWNLPDAKWFVGAQTNLAYNCLDLQISRGRGDHTAIL